MDRACRLETIVIDFPFSHTLLRFPVTEDRLSRLVMRCVFCYILFGGASPGKYVLKGTRADNKYVNSNAKKPIMPVIELIVYLLRSVIVLYIRIIMCLRTKITASLLYRPVPVEFSETIDVSFTQRVGHVPRHPDRFST